MRVQVVVSGGTLDIDTAHGWQERRGPIPCHRCGVCCERWQPLLTREDAERLAEHVGLAAPAFHEAYTTPYPFDDERHLLRQEGGRCVFLRYEEGGRSACSVHAFRPAVCREWQAGLDKKECVQGLERFAGPGGLIPLEVMYPSAVDRAGFVAAAGEGERQRRAGS